MAVNPRVAAAEAYVKAYKSGEESASRRAAQFLSEDVVLNTGREEVKGFKDVLDRVTGIWAQTPTLMLAGWSFPKEEGDKLVVDGKLPPLGAAPQEVKLTFSFDKDNKISRIDQETKAAGPQPPSNTIPQKVKGNIDSALANGTPIVVAYTDPSGQPILSLRGSTQTYSDNQLCIWLRNAEGGLVNAMNSANNRISFLYRDSKTRTTIIVQGRGHLDADPAVRERVYNLAPEVEQKHDPGHKGAALIIDVDRLQGGTPEGMYRMQREGA